MGKDQRRDGDDGEDTGRNGNHTHKKLTRHIRNLT
jgi:hypothetical protein